MLAGLIGNALGWHWSNSAAHQAMQDRMIFGARIEREGVLLTDSQNVQLAKNDKGWTTVARPKDEPVPATAARIVGSATITPTCRYARFCICGRRTWHRHSKTLQKRSTDLLDHCI